MNNSPVLELQSLASSSIVDVQDILLKAKMISVKLGLNDITDWLEFEINGYCGDKNLVPKYRIIKGVPIRAYNPYQGLILVNIDNIEDAEIYEIVSTVYIDDAISALQQYSNKIEPIYRSMPKPIKDFLHNSIPDSRGFELVWMTNSLEVNRIISSVKAKVLDWSLELEQKGIIGEGLLFTQKEKEVAHMTVNNTNNFNGTVNNAGVIGSGNSDFSQKNTIKVGDLESLEKELRELGVSEEDLKGLKLAINETPIKVISKDNLGAKINTWIGNMVGKAFSGGLNITADVATIVLANAICAYYGILS